MRASVKTFAMVWMLLASCVPNVCSNGQQYHRKYDTIAHRLLDMESEAEPIPDSSWQLLDDLIAEALERIGKHSDARGPEEERQFAETALTEIDRTLTAHNFVFPPEGLVDTLGDAFVPHKLTATQLDELSRLGSNYRRGHQINGNAAIDGNFYFVDCKTSSMIYLAIGGLANLPLHSVDIPGHVFVRWNSGAQVMDWDTNMGGVRDDEFYEEEAAMPSELVERRVFLSNMSIDSVLGYWHDLVGWRFEKLKIYDRALAEHRKAVELYPITGMEQNNLAWFLATCPGSKCRDGHEATKVALRAIEIWEEPNRLDTLAAAYAESHQWIKAVRTEMKAKALARSQKGSAFESDPSPDFDRFIEAYRNHRTYVQEKGESLKRPLNDYHPEEAERNSAQ